jgi:broad specificity phosphatase PhoE
VAAVSEVWIVQHAEKEREAANPADPGLTEKGWEQARRTAAYLAETGRFDLICSSPLLRTRQTAKAISERLGLPVRLDERLRERMNWGEGPEGAARQTVEEFLREWERATKERDYVPTPGDSSRAAGERFRMVLEELETDVGEGGISAVGSGATERRALLVSHGGVTVDLLRSLFGDDVVRAAVPGATEGGMPSCGITRLGRGEGAWVLLGAGDVAHLDGRE